MSADVPVPEGVKPEDFHAVLQELQTYLRPSSIPKWLRGANMHLGGRSPISALQYGELDAVLDAIKAEQGGSYA